MGGFLKDLAALVFAAGGLIEKKTRELREAREARAREFNEAHGCGGRETSGGGAAARDCAGRQG